MKARQLDQDRYYEGVPMVSYDLIKELVLAVVASGVVVLLLAFGLSSPDVPSATIKGWATADPVDFVTTATSELAGTSTSASYGPPYSDGSDSVQAIGPFAPQRWAGNAIHLNTAQEFVLGPLGTVSADDPTLSQAIATYEGASTDQQQAWLSAYSDALASATAEDGSVKVAAGQYGPVPMLTAKLLSLARSGTLDGLLLASPRFYQTNYTTPLLFLGDGTYFANLAEQQHLLGSQWGMMNETGNYPGQSWLWLYTLWYQVPPFNTAPNADLLVVLTMGLLTTLLALVPYIPILRDIPRWIPIHRFIWRSNDW
jgi:hypothetical protein